MLSQVRNRWAVATVTVAAAATTVALVSSHDAGARPATAHLATAVIPVAPAAPVAPRVQAQQQASRGAATPVRRSIVWHPSGTTATGIPRIVEKAYANAAKLFTRYAPACKLDKALLEAIGKVESDHAYNGYVDRKGQALIPIIGPALDGHPGVDLIHASPLGTKLHGDPVYEHAVGPMQFLPGTFADWATAGNPKHRTADPENVFDAAATAAKYLCGSGGDLSDPTARRTAVLHYNNSQDYANTVEGWFQAYSHGFSTLPDSKDAAAAQRYAKADNPPPAAPKAAPGAPAAPAQPAAPASKPAWAPGPATPQQPAKPGSAPPPAAPKQPAPTQPAPKGPTPVGDALGRLTGAQPGKPTTSPTPGPSATAAPRKPGG